MKRITEAALLSVFCLLLYLPGLTTIPPLDRDEARFAQASKQMLETGDFVDIRFQEKPRYKKPAGPYWLQAASSAALRPWVGDQIWTYRLPSVLAAMMAVLLTWEIGRLLFNRRCGLIAGGLLAGSVLLVSEAHQAKSDAVLLATIVAMFWSLARLRHTALNPNTTEGRSSSAWPAWVFWAGLGASVMVKGPIGFLVVGLFLVTLIVSERQAAWVRPLLHWPAIMLAVLIALPWYVAITWISDGAFLAQAIGKDLAPKLTGGVEAHGAWPGYYTFLTLVMAFPASLFLWPSVLGWRQAWASPNVRFLLAWALPALLVFELIPTKLPHYVLPAYPALMLIAGAALSGAVVPLSEALRGRSAKIWAILWAMVAGALGLVGSVIMFRFGGGAGDGPMVWFWAMASLGAGVLSGFVGLRFVWRQGKPMDLAVTLLSAALNLAILTGGVLPRATDLQVSKRLAAAADLHARGEPVAITGYHEPSAVFLISTDLLLASPVEAAAHLRRHPNGLTFVEDNKDIDFRAAVQGFGFEIAEKAIIRGLNYSRGRPVTIRLYQRR